MLVVDAVVVAVGNFAIPPIPVYCCNGVDLTAVDFVEVRFVPCYGVILTDAIIKHYIYSELLFKSCE